MSFNVPNFNTNRFTFGPGILYMGAPGTTPLLDIGAVTGDATLEINRTLLEVMQGTPQQTVIKYAVEEEISMKVTGIEWNLFNLSYLLGAGVTTQTGAQEIMDFGGDMAVSNRAVRFVHIQPDGSTIDVQLFNVQGTGKISIAMKQKAIHEIPYEFSAIIGTTDFQGNVVTSPKNKMRIIRTQH